MTRKAAVTEKPTDLEVFFRMLGRYFNERSNFRGNVREDEDSFSSGRELRKRCLKQAGAIDKGLREGLDGFFHLELSDRLDELPGLRRHSALRYPESLESDEHIHDAGIEQRLEALLNAPLGEGHFADVNVVWHDGRRLAEMSLYKVLERQTVRIGGRDIEEYFVDRRESISPFPLKTGAYVGRGRIFYCLDQVLSPRWVAEQWTQEHEAHNIPLHEQIVALYKRSLVEDTLTFEGAVEEMVMHEREHIRYTISEGLIAAFKETGLLEGLPDRAEWRDAIIEAAPLLLQLAASKMPNYELAQAINRALLPVYRGDHHQPAAILVMNLLCRYNDERGRWIDTSGDTLQERLRDIDKLTVEQVREAAGYWHNKFYEIKMMEDLEQLNRAENSLTR